MVAQVKITVGSHVWVKAKESAWVEGEVTLIDDDDVEVTSPKDYKTWTQKEGTVWISEKDRLWTKAAITSRMHVKRLGTTSGTVVTDKVLKAAKLSVFPGDTKAPPKEVADLIELSHLHEPLILQHLANRYKNNDIYTYAGNILIAINPYKNKFPNLYDEMQKYKDAKTKDPHVFAVAEIAYRSMINEEKSNSILVSGESGAGKTEATKRLMTYLARMDERSETEETTIEKKLLQSTPVLEAFGNAKTERNNNSSRFGKYVEIQFDNKWRISGADIKTYLLERSRVCRISNPERNYHCFYLVLAAPPEDIEKYGLEGCDAKSFHYLNQSKCYELDGVNDAHEYLETRKAMKTVGISEEEQEAIFRVVAAILHLGNIEFEDGREAESSAIKDKKPGGHFDMTAKLLMCNEGDLEKALINRVMNVQAQNEAIPKNLERDAAAVSRDGLARTIYARLFDWLVEKINNSIGKVPNSKLKSIGLLDIYGFEILKNNSFEQFCINYANEKLQKHFNQHVFQEEEKVYEQERIEWSRKEFVGNDTLLERIEEKHTGIIARLDADYKLPKSKDETSAQRSCRVLCDDGSRDGKFTLPHYAEMVTYEAKEFLEKNEDYVVPEHTSLLIHSKCPFIRGKLFPQLGENASAATPFFKSIGTCFKEQLQELIKTLEGTQPHYIRCVKPNDELKPDDFKMVNVSKQLHCGGVFEAIRVFCAGYPTRQIYKEFLKRYDILPQVLEGMNCDQKKEACKMILDILGLEGYKIGKTKIFLRNGVLAELDARMALIKEAETGDLAKKLYKYLRQREVAEVENLKVEVENLKAKNEELRKKLEDANTDALRANTDAEKLRKKLEDVNTDAEELRKKLEYANTDALQANTDVEELRKKLEDANIDAEDLRKKLEDANTDALQANTDVEEMSKKLEDANIDAKDLRKKLEDANTDAEDLKKKLEDANTDAEDLRKKLKNANIDAEDMRKKLEDANTDAEELKKKLKDAADEIKETKKANTDARAKIVELTKKLTDAQAKIVELTKNFKDVDTDAQTRIVELTKKLTNARAKIVELTKKLEDADNKVGQLLLKSLEEKLSNNGSPTNGSAQQGAANFQTPPDNGNVQNEQIELALENQDLLTKCISQGLGYSGDRPVAAFIIYKCLLQWRSFDTQRTRVFDRIIQTMGSAAIEAPDNNDVQAYWLSNSSTLLLLLQRSPRPSSQLGRIFKFALRALRPLRQIAGLQFFKGQRRQFEAKCPALLFKQQLTPFLEKRYGTMRDNLKKDISQLLELCIQAPRTSKASVVNGHPQANAIAHWQSIVKILNGYLNIMKANYVSPFLVRKVFTQIFYFINVQLFNSLLLWRECCSFSNGEYVKAGLAELEQWCFDATEEYAGSAWDKMKHIRQAVGFLVTHEKTEKTLEDITNDLCPKLSIQQLYRICNLYWDDKYGTRSVSSDVISSMRVISNNAVSSSFLLDDDSSIPFSVDDISKSMQQIDINLDPLCKASIFNGCVM